MKARIGPVLLLLVLFPMSAFADDQLAIQAYSSAQKAFSAGNYADANQKAQQALKNASPAQADLIIFSNEILAHIANHEKRYEEAAALYDKIVLLAGKQHLPNRKMLTYKRNLAGAYMNAKQPEKAEPLLKEWLAFQEKNAPPDTVEIGKSAITLGQVEYELQQYDASKAYLTKGLELLEQRLPETDRWIVLSRRYLNALMDKEIKAFYEQGMSAFSQGQKTEAVQNWQSALSLAHAMNIPNDPRIADLEQKIAQAGKIENTETYLQNLTPGIRRWDEHKKAVVVYIQPNNIIPQWTTETLQPLVHQAFSSWRNALDNKIRFEYTDNPNHYDVRVSWAASNPKNISGKTLFGKNIFYSQGHYLTQNDIELFIPMEHPLDKARTEVYTTLLHEAGHMMGITGHSTNPSDVMYAYSDFNSQLPTTLSSRDIATIRTIYTMKPQCTNPPNDLLSDYKPAQSRNGEPIVSW